MFRTLRSQIQRVSWTLGGAQVALVYNGGQDNWYVTAEGRVLGNYCTTPYSAVASAEYVARGLAFKHNTEEEK